MLFVRAIRQAGVFVLTLLLIEFLDELVFGVREAAWPLIRDDLRLDYAQVGLLLSMPGLVSNILEPFIGILGDVWRRRALVLGGGVVFGLAGSLLPLGFGWLSEQYDLQVTMWLLLLGPVALLLGVPRGGSLKSET